MGERGTSRIAHSYHRGGASGGGFWRDRLSPFGAATGELDHESSRWSGIPAQRMASRPFPPILVPPGTTPRVLHVMSMARTLSRFLLVLPLLVGVAACDSVGGGAESASGSFRVLLTDAPGAFQSAVVTIESVSLEGEAGAVVLREEPVTVDLLDLQNEVMDLVAGVDVPAGSYAELRLVISGGYVAVEEEDGSTKVYASSDAYAAAQGVEASGRLQMPSYAESGLKVKLPGGSVEVEGGEQVVLLDFNVAESFGRQAGQSGGWVMRPVVRASDFRLTGTAEVALALGEGVALPSDTLSLADFSAVLQKEGGEEVRVAFTDANGDGAFEATLRYLAPGSHTVGVEGPAALSFEADVPLPLEVVVESGATARASVTVSAAGL